MKPKKAPPQPVRDLFAAPHPASIGDQDNHPRARGGRTTWSLSRQRNAEIRRLIEYRHGGTVETDRGSEYLDAILPSVVDEAGGFRSKGWEKAVAAFVRGCTPFLSDEEAAECIARAQARNAAGKLHWTASQLGLALSLTLAEREHLNIRAIRPADVSAREFQKHRRAKKAEREKAAQAAKRVAEGATPRSLSKKAVAEAMGIPYSTYRRHLAEGRLTYPPEPSEHFSSSLEAEPLRLDTGRCSQPPERTLAGPARKATGSQNVGANVHPHGGKTRAVPAGRAVALPSLPGKAVSSQSDLIGEAEAHAAQALELIRIHNWTGGPMAPDLRQAVRDAARVRGASHQHLADVIGLSRQQVTNSLRERGGDGFGRNAASNLKLWLSGTRGPEKHQTREARNSKG